MIQHGRAVITQLSNRPPHCIIMGAMSQSNCNRLLGKHWLAVAMTASALVGCDRDSGVHSTEVTSNGPGPAIPSTTGPSEADSRLEAANAIIDTSSRDSALQEVAVYAAEQNRIDVVRKSLDKMVAVPERDAATARCAVGLTRAGNTQAAMEVAGRIMDTTQRDKALAKIAKGETN